MTIVQRFLLFRPRNCFGYAPLVVLLNLTNGVKLFSVHLTSSQLLDSIGRIELL